MRSDFVKKIWVLVVIISLLVGCQAAEKVEVKETPKAATEQQEPLAEKEAPQVTVPEEVTTTDLEKDNLETVVQETNTTPEAVVLEEVDKKESEIFGVKDNTYYIKGITLGDARSTVINILGTPRIEEVDESGYSDFTLIYDNLYVGITNNLVSSLYIIIDKNTFEESLTKQYSEVKFVNEEADIIYYYKDVTNQVIFGKIDNGSFGVYLSYIDGNFRFGLSEGWIKPATE